MDSRVGKRQPAVLGVAVAALLVLLAPAVGCSVSDAPADEMLVIGDEPTCPTCEIRLVPVLRFGETSGPGIIARDSNPIARSPEGKYYVAAWQEGRVRVFSSRGEYETVFGQSGQGPREFSGIGAIKFRDAGEIWIYDQMGARVSVFNARHEFIRNIPFQLGTGFSALLREDGTTILSLMRRPRDANVSMLHIVSPSGAVLSSFDEHDGGRFVNPRVLAWTRDRDFWSGDPSTYEVRRWTSDWKLQGSFRRQADWFPTDPAIRRPTFEQPLWPTLISLHQADDGLLWAVTLVPDEHWRDAVIGKTSDGELIFSQDDDAIYDTIVEIIDVTAGELVAGTRLPGFISSDLGDGLFAAKVDDGFETYVQVSRLELVKGDS